MSHILRAQWARVVSGDCIGEHRYKTFASLLYWMVLVWEMEGLWD